MGLGDQLLASGMAKGAKDRGKRIAFGDGRKIIWDHNTPKILDPNPNVAKPGSEGASDLEWIAYYKGSRIYNKAGNGHWIWNYDFRPIPGEVYFNITEKMRGDRAGKGFIVIEPNVEAWKPMAINKQWGEKNWVALADKLRPDFRLIQFKYTSGQHNSGKPLPGVEQIETQTFRDSLSVLKRAALYVGSEGGLHHGAAAMGTKAVVIFGGFVPPQVTGYDMHVNLAAGGEACGSFKPCDHCRKAMEEITLEQVYDGVISQMRSS
jgi:ADP-heptose:LPS heptosyltransferase